MRTHTAVTACLVPVIAELMDRDAAPLTLPEGLLRSFAKEPRTFRLVAPAGQSEAFLEQSYLETARSRQFAEWPDRFTAVAELLARWATHADLRSRATAFLQAQPASSLRDFSLAHWHALLPRTAEGRSRGRKRRWTASVRTERRPRPGSWSSWSRGLGKEAVTLARSSPR